MKVLRAITLKYKYKRPCRQIKKLKPLFASICYKLYYKIMLHNIGLAHVGLS